MVDIIAALMTGAAADAGIAAQVSTRVFAMELPLKEAEFMPRKALVFKWASRREKNNYSGVHQLGVDALCYGESFAEAEAVRRAASDFLDQIGNSSPLFAGGAKISAVGPSGLLAPFRDPEKQWPIIAESWLVTAHEELVS